MWKTIAAGLLLASAGHTASAEDSKPFPVDRTQILKSGGVYVVTGRVHIGKGVEVTVQKDTKVIGGSGGGIIEVEGELNMHGVSGGEVILEGVTVELAEKFGNVHTDTVTFRGASAGIVSPKDVAVDGRLFVDGTTFQDGSTVDVTMSANWVDLQHCTFQSRVHVKAVIPKGSSTNKVRLNVMNNSGFNSDVLVEGVADVTVRTNVFKGGTVTFKDCGSLTFDTNHVKCRTLEFVQSESGGFGRTTMSKCDVQCESILLIAPVNPKKPESMSCDKCWFNGETSEKAVRAKVFKDHDDDPASGVTVDILKIMEKPLGLAGPVSK